MNTEQRLKIINNSDWNVYFKEFLIQNINEPLPDTPEWKNNISYSSWIQKMHRIFREGTKWENNYYAASDKNYQEEFTQWLKKQKK